MPRPRPSPRSIALGLGAALAMAAGAGLGACGELEVVELGICGNRVLEPELGEDCDGSPGRLGSSFSCGEPGSAGACRLVCNADPAAEGPGCPAGWGCGADGICRQPSAEFQAASLPGVARAVGDLDGDGRDDVVLRGLQGELQVAFFSETRALAELFVDGGRRPLSDDPPVLPVVTKMTGDNIDDLALPLIGDDVTVRVFTGSSTRQLVDPFVELVTTPFGSQGSVAMETAFNPFGAPEAICEIGGCAQSLLLASTDGERTHLSILDDRSLVELFALLPEHRRHTMALARWDESLPCDDVAISYRHTMDGSPGNRVDLFSLCVGEGQLNRSPSLDPLGPVPAFATVSVSNTDPADSLVISGRGDVNGDGHADLLLDIDAVDGAAEDPPETFVLYGIGDGHFNSRADLTGELDVADRSNPLIRGHTWASSTDRDIRLEHLAWPRAMADINGDGYADYLLAAGFVALSTPDPNDVCLIAGETVISGPPVGLLDEPQWGYACLLVSEDGLIDAASALRQEIVRDWWSSDSLATHIEVQGGGVRGFAAIDKNKIEYTGQPTDHSPTDTLDLIWVDPATSQLVMRTIEGAQFEEVAAGDVDGDFEIDLVYAGGSSVQVIWGPPFDPVRAVKFSPVGFDVLRVFGEGLPSASLGAERDGRLTIFRDGQWPALALLEPGECPTPDACHVRFASGASGDESHYAWALGLVQGQSGGGLRLLRAVTGVADLGPAYDSTASDLVPMDELGMTASPDRATVLAIELGSPGGEDASAPVDELIVAGTIETGLELAVLQARVQSDPSGSLCGEPFEVELELGVPETRAVCFERVANFSVNGVVRGQGKGLDPFLEVGDADGDGHLDLSWVTVDNHVMVIRGDGSGTLSTDNLMELAMTKHDESAEAEVEDEGAGVGPARIDWVRWIELDGTSGRELVSGDRLGSGRIWRFDVELDSLELEPLDSLLLEGIDGQSVGLRGDFDGDGVEDVAVANRVLFGQAVND